MGSTLATQLRQRSDGFGHSWTRIEACPSEQARLITELTRAIRAREEFIAIAAHELRNPMTPILGYVEHALAVAAARSDPYRSFRNFHFCGFNFEANSLWNWQRLTCGPMDQLV